MQVILKRVLKLFRRENEEDDKLESPEEKKRRWSSIKIVYYTIFIMSFGFSTILTSIWPFLDKLDPSAGKEFLGYVIGANPMGQMIFSPIFGYWANKRGSIRVPVLTTLILFTFSNTLYSLLEGFSDNRKYWLVLARFLVGVSSANVAVIRSYLSTATRLKERTMAISMISLAQVLGFVAGPAVQGIFSFLGRDGYTIFENITFNMYTATGWFNALLGAINLVLLLPYFFKEHQIATREVMVYQGKTDEKETWKAIKPDYLVTWTLIFTFFILSFSFVLLETLASPLSMDQFGWTKRDTLFYIGLIMAIEAMLSIFVFLFIKQLTTIFEERKLLLWGGLFTITISVGLLFPWGSEPPKLALPKNYTLQQLKQMIYQPQYSNYTLNNLVLHLAEDEEMIGCPVTQTWCENTNAILISQFIISFAILSIAYTLGITLIQTIFSKSLGPRPQGVWMGLLTGSGCLSRVLGPIFVSFIYSRYGTIMTFTTIIIVLSISLIWIKIINKRLVPADLGERKMEINIEIK